MEGYLGQFSILKKDRSCGYTLEASQIVSTPTHFLTDLHQKKSVERGGSVVERRTPSREVGVRNLPPPCHILEQDTLLPESTGNTQEAMDPSRHD